MCHNSMDFTTFDDYIAFFIICYTLSKYQNNSTKPRARTGFVIFSNANSISYHSIYFHIFLKVLSLQNRVHSKKTTTIFQGSILIYSTMHCCQNHQIQHTRLLSGWHYSYPPLGRSHPHCHPLL